MVKNIDLNKLSFVELQKKVNELNTKKESVAEKRSDKHPFIIGKNYLIRTVTMIYTGRLEAVYDNELVISTASWIPDSGRWQQAVENGNFSEVEPYPKDSLVVIGRQAILDATIIGFNLPVVQK